MRTSFEINSDIFALKMFIFLKIKVTAIGTLKNSHFKQKGRYIYEVTLLFQHLEHILCDDCGALFLLLFPFLFFFLRVDHMDWFKRA